MLFGIEIIQYTSLFHMTQGSWVNWNSVTVTENILEPFSSEIITYGFSRVKPNPFFMYVSASNYFDISKLDYVSVSAQIE